ncbi:nucleoside hydrolase [Defluviitalea phaphyphila]|uniref:nucleoside hydrolase n=1 Tax=Defluviitalea phaphyphila TaxID=1473580 RepID=UPI000730618B|nr:nucleoside hydrolase [Defluviitalea phaphyphila]
MKKKVILDFDNTMGVRKSDIDDGFTFAYLYTHEDIDLLAVTCTFANNALHVVYSNTKQMWEDLGITDVPIYKGGRWPESYDSEAVDYLVKAVNEAPGEITILAIGSLCNIAGAYTKDPDFFNKIDRLIVMGGITEPLYLNGSLLNELNFSVDYKSAAKVLYNCPNLSILTAQCTQDAIYKLEDLDEMLKIDTKFMRWSRPIVSDWIKSINAAYGNRKVFINWDLCTAIYLTNPELFSTSQKRLCKIEENLKTGWLQIDEDGTKDDSMVNVVDIPDKIIDIDKFNALFYEMISKME